MTNNDLQVQATLSSPICFCSRCFSIAIITLTKALCQSAAQIAMLCADLRVALPRGKQQNWRCVTSERWPQGLLQPFLSGPLQKLLPVHKPSLASWRVRLLVEGGRSWDLCHLNHSAKPAKVPYIIYDNQTICYHPDSILCIPHPWLPPARHPPPPPPCPIHPPASLIPATT